MAWNASLEPMLIKAKSILTTVVSVLRLPTEVDEYADRSVAISYGLVGSALQFLHLCNVSGARKTPFRGRRPRACVTRLQGYRLRDRFRQIRSHQSMDDQRQACKRRLRCVKTGYSKAVLNRRSFGNRDVNTKVGGDGDILKLYPQH